MSFDAPGAFGWLVLIPFVVAAYVSAQRRHAQRTASLASEGLVSTGGVASPGGRFGRRRHVPFALLVLALVVLVVALARPSTTVKAPRQQGTVVVALDVSNSMRATDVKPSRIEAAKAAARSFIKAQGSAVRVAVVAFGDGAVAVQAPTTNHDAALAAIDHVSVGGATSIGQGLLTSLNTIAGKPITVDPNALSNDEGKVDVGYYGGTAVVAFTDGENTTGPDPQSVAQVASAAGVRVHTVGVGSEAGTVFQYGGFSIATALDTDALKQIASTTDGTYHPVSDTSGVSSIAKTIRLHFTLVSQHTEVSAIFTAAAVVILLLAALLSLRWFGRVV